MFASITSNQYYYYKYYANYKNAHKLYNEHHWIYIQ